jgi:hypothetical protein
MKHLPVLSQIKPPQRPSTSPGNSQHSSKTGESGGKCDQRLKRKKKTPLERGAQIKN